MVTDLSAAGSGYMEEQESRLRQRTDGLLDRSRDPAILNAALASLIENGYNDTNMNDIAAPNWSRARTVMKILSISWMGGRRTARNAQ